jgi:Flp pilus assembly protein protease CpaA
LYTLIDLFSIGAALAASTAAAVIDYKTLKIPNRLTFPLILLGLLLMAVRCIAGYSPWVAALTCVTAYLFAYALWKGRLWGGGDAKQVLALFIVISPAYPPLPADLETMKPKWSIAASKNWSSTL